MTELCRIHGANQGQFVSDLYKCQMFVSLFLPQAYFPEEKKR